MKNPKNKIILVAVALVVVGLSVFLFSKKTLQNPITSNESSSTENSLVAVKSPDSTISDEQIYKNPFVTHIRVALDSYLKGTNQGMDFPEVVINAHNENRVPGCGLSKFSKDYYQGKFIVLDSDTNELGGRQTDIVFIDKPDKIFWTWVYPLGDGSYSLRGFCENGPSDEIKADFPEMIQKMIKDGKFPYSL